MTPMVFPNTYYLDRYYKTDSIRPFSSNKNKIEFLTAAIVNKFLSLYFALCWLVTFWGVEKQIKNK